MAARINLRHDEETRLKIQTSQFINRLTAHILNDVPMSKTQVAAALGLLKKTLPDLSNVDMTVAGDKERPIVLQASDAGL